VTLRGVRIDEALWAAAPPERRSEWSTLIADLLRDEDPWPGRAGTTLVVGCDDQAIVFRFSRSDLPQHDLDAEAAIVPRGELRAMIDEYVGVIDRLGEGDLHPMRMEALDMAKRVVHDGGARRLGELLPELSPSLAARRRLFSLVVSVVEDTTRRPWAHRHA
jgi:uncharacterized protein (UPF0262 family)